MNHGDYLVDLLDAQGKVVGAKPRRDINKTKDVYHVVFVFLMTARGEIIASVIPQRQDLPNVYVHQVGATVASIRRQGETAQQAASRALAAEVACNADVHLVSEQMATFSDGRQSFISVFTAQSESPANYSERDIEALVVMTPAQLDELVGDNSPTITPTLHYMWQTFKTDIIS